MLETLGDEPQIHYYDLDEHMLCPLTPKVPLSSQGTKWISSKLLWSQYLL